MTAAGRCIFYFYNMISGSKGQKVVRACTIRLLNLEPAKHEEVAIYVVNLRIPNVWGLRKLPCSGAIRRYQNIFFMPYCKRLFCIINELFSFFKYATQIYFVKICEYPDKIRKKMTRTEILIIFPKFSLFSSSQYGNRTRVFAVRGRRLNPLTNWPFVSLSFALRCRLV